MTLETLTIAQRLVDGLHKAQAERRIAPEELGFLQFTLLDVARSPSQRLKLRQLLRGENYADLRPMVETVLFEAVQRLKDSLTDPRAAVRGRIEFVKAVSIAVVAGSILAMLTLSVFGLPLVFGGASVLAYAHEQARSTRVDKALSKIVADIARLEETLRLIQNG